MNKFELFGEIVEFTVASARKTPSNEYSTNTLLHCKRVRALRDIPKYGVKAGDIGGFVDSESCLSQEGDSWVAENGVVALGSVVSEDAFVGGNAVVCNRSVVKGTARVVGNALVEMSEVSGTAVVEGFAEVGYSTVGEGAHVADNAAVVSNSVLGGSCRVLQRAYVADSTIKGETEVSGVANVADSTVGGKSVLTYRAHVKDGSSLEDVFLDYDAVVSNSTLKGGVEVSGNVNIVNSEVVGYYHFCGSTCVQDTKLSCAPKTSPDQKPVLAKKALYLGDKTFANYEVTLTANLNGVTVVCRPDKEKCFVVKDGDKKPRYFDDSDELTEFIERKIDKTPVVILKNELRILIGAAQGATTERW